MSEDQFPDITSNGVVDPDKYQAQSAVTASMDTSNVSAGDLRQIHDIMVDAIREGDFVEKIKKSVFYNKPYMYSVVPLRQGYIKDMSLSHREVQILHWTLGLVGESCEVMRLIYLHVYYKEPLEASVLCKELGDVTWYAANLATEFGLHMSEVFSMNARKLWIRFKGKFSTEAAIARVDTSDTSTEGYPVVTLDRK